MDEKSAQQQDLVRRLAASSNPVAKQLAPKLAKLYHDRQMDGLAQDVYSSAKGEGHPPAGWTRLTESPQLMAEFAPRLHVDSSKLYAMLKPDASGFRAEIYVPDPKVIGPDYKLAVSFKGSSGLVMTSDGRTHDTTSEDFLANNFAQSIGMETDYYDRAMNLAILLKKSGLHVEYTGHSLSGGMASAAAMVTGERATTFNAAGLHPKTVERFAQQHHGVSVAADPTQLITAYQVSGELLNDGVQGNIDRMDVIERTELAGVLKESCDLLHRVPAMRGILERQLVQNLPLQAQQAVREFVRRVATGDTGVMLAQLPLAAGDVHVLAPMTRDADGRLVPRAPTMSLPEATELARPVLQAATAAAAGARVGERAGELVAGLGRLESRALRLDGDGTRAAGEMAGDRLRNATLRRGMLLQAGEHYAGAALAEAREAQAELRAQIDQAVGESRHAGAELDAGVLRGVGRLLPGDGQAWMEAQAERVERAGEDAQRQALAQAATERALGRVDAKAIRGMAHAAEAATAQAADRYGSIQHDAVASLGKGAADHLEAMAERLQAVSQQAPAAYAGLGAAGGFGIATVLELQPANYPRLAGVAAVIQQGRQAGAEAFERHLMAPTVTPSMDGRIAEEEQRAQLLLQRSDPSRASVVPPTSARESVERAAPDHLRDFRHPDHPANPRYQTTLGKVHAMEEAHGIPHGPHSERVAARLVDRMHEQRFGGLGRLALHGEGRAMQVVAFESRPSYFMHERVFHLDLEQATASTVEQATLDWSRRALPHLHRPAELPPSPPITRQPDLGTHARDPRHPRHPRHDDYLHWRGRVADAYASVGVVRNEDQLEQATAAVMLGVEKAKLGGTRPSRLFLPVDPQTGVIDAERGLVLLHQHPAMNLLTSIGTQDMQRMPADSYQQMAQQEQHAQANMQMPDRQAAIRAPG